MANKLYDKDGLGSSGLGSLASTLTKGRVSSVGFGPPQEIKKRDSSVIEEEAEDFGSIQGRKISMPTEEELPDGYTLDSVRGLFDSKIAAESSRTDNSLMPSKGMTSLNKLLGERVEDGRCQRLMGKDFHGCVENFKALSEKKLEVANASAQIDDLLAVKAKALAHFGNDENNTAYKEVSNEIDKAINTCAALNVFELRSGAGKTPVKDMEFLKKVPWHETITPHFEAVEQDIDELVTKSQTTLGVYEGVRKLSSKLSFLDWTEPPPPPPSCEKQQGDGEGRGEGEGDNEHGNPFKNADRNDKPSDDQDGEGKEENGGMQDSRAKQFMQGDNGDKMAQSRKTIVDQIEAHLAKNDDKEVGDVDDTGRLIKSDLIYPIYPCDTVAMSKIGLDRPVSFKADSCRNKYKQAYEKVKAFIAPIRSRLKMKILAETRTKVKTEMDNGHLSERDIYKIPNNISQRVFKQIKKKKTIKTAITLLIDQSGSMGSGEFPAAYSSSRNTKLYIAGLCAVALAESLRGIQGVYLEVLGFTSSSSGHSNKTLPRDKRKGGQVCARSETLVHRVHKDFKSKDLAGLGAMFGIETGNNIDGESVRWAARRNLKQKAERRILIVLSDGYPAAAINNHVGTSGEAVLHTDLRSAVKACEDHGIETIGIGITSDAVKAFYPKYAIVENPKDLATTVLGQISSLLDPENAKRLVHEFAKKHPTHK